MARIVIPGIPYHITQRGNDCRQVFFCATDYHRYLIFLKTYARQYEVDILGYSLMPNHIHVIGIPHHEQSLARVFGYTHQKYAQQMHHGSGQSGHFWQDRFYSCPMDHAYLLCALRYVERNPVRAGLVTHVKEYLWSSASVHLGEVNRMGILNLTAFTSQWDIASWQAYLGMDDDRDDLETIRRHTTDGTPLGGMEFQERIRREIAQRRLAR